MAPADFPHTGRVPDELGQGAGEEQFDLGLAALAAGLARPSAAARAGSSMLRQAADLDYQLTVLADCCADADEEVQRVLLGKVFPRQADVLSAQAWTATLQRR